MELEIKTAAEYAAEETAATRSAEDSIRDAVIGFINSVLKPEIEDRIANPKKYTGTGYTSLKIPTLPSGLGYVTPERFVSEVETLLKPLGYSVRQSHDGGGMYATVVITWKPTTRKTR